MISAFEAGICNRVDALMKRLASKPEYPTQGRTLFVDLQCRSIKTAYTPLRVIKTFLTGRGSNMYYLYNLLDTSLSPFHPDIPLIFGTGLLTGIVPSAARANVTSWSPETGILMDSNAGDYVPSFMKLNEIDHLVIYGDAPRWTILSIEKGDVKFLDAETYLGLNNIDFRERIQRDLKGKERRDMAIACITEAGERRALCSGIMAGPKSLWARGGTGAKMGSLKLKAVVFRGFVTMNPAASDEAEVKPANRDIAKKYLETSVVKNALKVYGTPFLYKPSRILGAMGTKNNQETTWSSTLDAEHLDKYRPGMEGCFRCPVNCRPLNDLGADGKGDRYDSGDGPEYVTVGKFGPNIGISDPRALLRLNNICNDLGFDTASMGSSLSWALELYQRGIIDERTTGGIKLEWGDAELFERLLFMTSRREGFGDILADSAAAVRTGKYPKDALKYRMAVKGLFQSDPHDSRILKAFALGLGVSTRGMDHLRNRVTLEINSRINDDPAYKAELYGAGVSPEPNSYAGKEIAVRVCENIFAVGDSLGMCRFTTKLFNSPNLPDYDDFIRQLKNVAGIALSKEEIDRIGLNIMGIERMINHRLGTTAEDDTLPDRWFEEAIVAGPYKGEKIDRQEFAEMKSRFYAVSDLTGEGIPRLEWRKELANVIRGFAVTVSIPNSTSQSGRTIVVDETVADIGALVALLIVRLPDLAKSLDDEMINVAVNGNIVMHNRNSTPLSNGDNVEFIPMIGGG